MVILGDLISVQYVVLFVTTVAINCIMSAVLWVGPYHRSVMESFHLELVWVMASFLPEQNMGRAASFSVYHCPVGQSLDPSSPATIKNPLKGAPLIVTLSGRLGV